MNDVAKSFPGVTSTRPRSGIQDTLVVDLDVHVHETPAELLPYCERPWQRSLEIAARHREHYLDVPGFAPGGNFGDLAKWPTGHEGKRIVADVPQMRTELGKLYIDLAVLFPDALLMIAMISNADYAAALAAAYNAWLLDRWCEAGNGLLACLVVAPQNPEAAANEIKRYAHHPSVVGIYLPCSGLSPLWGHQSYNSIFAAANEAQLPVLLHSAATIWPVYPFNVQGAITQIGRHFSSHTFPVMANLVDMISRGVTSRFPDLRIVATEAGIAWVPFLSMRMDREYRDKRDEMHWLKERPSEHLRRQCFFATQPIEEPEDLHDFVQMVRLFGGEESVVFASDWPHHDFDNPTKVWQMPFEEDVKMAILGGNALRMLSIDGQGRRVAAGMS